jgi:hypothetical protein
MLDAGVGFLRLIHITLLPVLCSGSKTSLAIRQHSQEKEKRESEPKVVTPSRRFAGSIQKGSFFINQSTQCLIGFTG